MSGADTGALIDLIARELRDVTTLAEEPADAVATQLVGMLQSRFLIVPKPPAPGLPINDSTKGRA